MNAEKLWILAFITFIIGGILCTASRGSILALIAATIITSAALAGKSGNRAFAGGLLALLLVGGGLMSWAGQSEFVQERFAQMFDPDMSERGRVPNWNEALDTVPNNWTWGTGLGTYRFVYERFQNRFLGQTAHYHAENQFLQALIEGGALSLILLVAAIGLTSWSVYKLFKFGGNLNNALAVAGTFALSSQFIGGMFDFGLYIPSNTILMASICGIVIGRAALISLIGNAESFEQAEQANDGRNLVSGPTPELSHDLNEAHSVALSGRKTLPANVTNRRVARSYTAQLRDVAVRVRVPWLAMPTTIGILLLGCLFGSLEMHKAALVEQAIHGSPLLIVREIEEPETVRSVIQPLATALNQRYDDAVGHRHMGELLQHLYRAETYQTLMAAEPSLVMQMRSSTTSGDDNEEELSPAENPLNTSDRIVELWQKADMWHLHGTVRSLEREGNPEARNALLDRPSVEEILKPASRHMLLARHFCPTIPHVHYALAELSVVPGAEPNEELHLQRAKTLSPGDATLHYWSGVLNMNSKRTDQAIADWNASLTQTGLHLNEIMEGSKGKLTLGTILQEVIPPKADLLLTVARRKELSVPSRKKVQQVFLQHAAEALPMTDLPAGQHAYTAGTIYRLLGRLDEAEEQFEVAIRHDPDHTGWLYQYTLTLFELGRLDEALEQANRLTQIRQHPSYSKLKRNIIQKQAEGGSFHPTAMTSAP